MVEGVDHLESYFRSLRFLLLVALLVLRQFLLPELRLQELVFQQELLVELLELQEQKLGLFLGFELQHWELEHRSLVFLEQPVGLVFLLLGQQLLSFLSFCCWSNWNRFVIFVYWF